MLQYSLLCEQQNIITSPEYWASPLSSAAWEPDPRAEIVQSMLSPSHPLALLSPLFDTTYEGQCHWGRAGSWLDEAFVSPSSSPLITSDDIRGPLIDQFFSEQPSYWSTDNDQSIRIGTENGWMAGGSFESLTSFRSHLLFICLDIDQYHCMFNVPESR